MFVAALTPSAQGMCQDRLLSLKSAHVSQGSSWLEINATGRELVKESGMLQGSEMGFEFKCQRLNFKTQLQRVGGNRVYDGQTSAGVPAVSRSALHQTHQLLQTQASVTDSLKLGLRVSHQTTSRDIASAAGAAGYPENFKWMLMSIGSEWDTHIGFGQVSVSVWYAIASGSRMNLNLPGRDTTHLVLGTIGQKELELGWIMPLGAAWHIQARAQYRETYMAQGNDTVIKREGIAVGVAHQPQTRVVETPVTLGLEYKF